MLYFAKSIIIIEVFMQRWLSGLRRTTGNRKPSTYSTF
nr:MAG TPA: hypothetical protein [Caudoviricetes sp.]